MRALRRAQSPEDIRAKSALAALNFGACPEFLESHRILFYLAMPEEVQTEAMVQEALRRNKQVFVPVVETAGGGMRIFRLPSLDIEFKRGALGIPEPAARDLPPADPGVLDLVVTPGLAFDRRGNRIGFGKGYFDRLLHQVRPPCQRLGLGFDFQVVETLPHSPGDAPVEKVVTDIEIITCGSGDPEPLNL